VGEVLKYLLDSDLISQPRKITPNRFAAHWLANVKEEETFISVVTLQEIQTGIYLLPSGKKRSFLKSWFEREVLIAFAARTLPVTSAIALESGRVIAAAKLAGHMADVGDAFIAATAIVHGLQMATLNRKHFLRLGVKLLDLERTSSQT
jgi:predicted nucleic acid-binding protein